MHNVTIFYIARAMCSFARNEPRPLPGDFSTSASATHPPLVEMTGMNALCL